MSLFDDLLNLNELPGLPTDEGQVRPLLERIDGTDDYILRIDNSTLEKFQTCSRAAEHYCIARRQRHGTAAMNFGSAIHLGLETFYRKGFSHLPEAVSNALELYSRFQQSDPDEWRTSTILEDTLIKYHDKYSKDEPISVIRDDKNVPMVEIPFSLVLGEILLDKKIDSYTSPDLPTYIHKLIILWSGRIDLAANYGDDSIYVVDHKTTSIGGPQFFADFMLSQQMVGYNWALRKLLPSHRITGIVVNAIIQRKPTRTGRALEFERQVYFHQDWHINEWERDVIAEVERFVTCFISNSWPKATKWCFGKYGKCEYHDVCTLPPEQRHLMLQSREYSNVTWSPLDDR